MGGGDDPGPATSARIAALMVDVPVTDRLELLIRRHEEELRKLAGEASLCAVSRAGKAVPAIKYQEGSTAVLRELRRRVESG